MRRLVWVFSAVVLSLTQGCCPLRPPGVPFSRTAHGSVIMAEGVTVDCGRRVLAGLAPLERRKLRQLMFIANLHMAAGNERSPMRLLRRVQRELAVPVAISRYTAARVLADLEAAVRALPRDERGHLRPLTNNEGWAAVRRMLAPVQGALPSRREVLRRIVAFSPDVAVAFLYREYFHGSHYHRYNMRSVLLEALVSSGVGAKALPFYAAVIRTAWRTKSGYGPYGVAIRGARAVLGSAFDHWYWEIRGKSYCADVR